MKLTLTRYLRKAASEPPFRLATRKLVYKFSRNLETRARWGVDAYPYYQFGILQGARMAKLQRQPAITVVEFGVCTGGGLLSMEEHARQIESSTGVSIKVVGFDSGDGLPTLIGDFRDQPDRWQPGSFKMTNFDDLRNRLDPMRTQLIIGDVRDTVPRFLEIGNVAPLGLSHLILIFTQVLKALSKSYAIQSVKCYFRPHFILMIFMTT